MSVERKRDTEGARSEREERKQIIDLLSGGTQWKRRPNARIHAVPCDLRKTILLLLVGLTVAIGSIFF